MTHATPPNRGPGYEYGNPQDGTYHLAVPDLLESAAVIVWHDEKVLLVQRSAHDPYPGAWVFPGGKIDEGDRVEGSGTDPRRRAAARELMEEAGIGVGAAALSYIWTLVSETGQRRYAISFFETTMPAGRRVVTDGREIQDHVWVKPSDVPGCAFVDAIPPATRRTLARLGEPGGAVVQPE